MHDFYYDLWTFTVSPVICLMPWHNCCHVKWRRVCRPLSLGGLFFSKPLGGLGVQDIDRAGLALRLRWQWFSRTETGRAWAGLDLQFSVEERSLFFASTSMIIGNGQTALFWEDRWIGGKSVSEIAPKLYACIAKRRRKLQSVTDGLHAHAWTRDIHGNLGVHEIEQYLLLWRTIEHTTLSDEPDQLIWKWSASSTYSARSCYFRGIHQLQRFKAHLEELGTAESEVLSLASQHGQVLDCRQIATPQPTAPP